MSKRNLAAFLWFLMGWTLGSMLGFFLDLPSGLNLVLAVLVAAAVWFDPTGRLWARGQNDPTSQATGRRQRSINSLADELDRDGAKRDRGVTDRVSG
jgi:hypothetical protein